MAPGIVSEEAALAVVAATNGVAADEPKKAEDVVNGVKAGISSEPNGELVNGITTEKAAETADVSEKSKEDAANGAETSHISDSASIKKDEKSAETKTDDDKAEEKKDEKKEPPKPQQVLVTLEVNPANGNVVVKEAKAKPPSQNFLLTLEVDPNGEVIVKKTKPDEKKDETKSDSKVDDTKKDADKEKGNEKEKDNTMKYEIKYLDRKYDDKDEPYFTERKTEEKQTEKSQPDWWQLYAFCIVRHYDYSNESVETTSMYVNAPQLRKLLADVIGNYPGHPIDEDEVQISAPYWPLFHYRKQIEEEGMKRFADDEQARKGLTLLLEWIDTHFKDEFAAFERCLSHEHHAIAYEHLWTLYPPNTIIYCKILNQNRAFRLNSCWYGCEPSFVARMEYVDFDGERIGLRHWELDISAYQGALEVADMTFMPFNLLEDADEVREELLTRGRKFEEYAHSQPKFMAYDAVALKRTHNGYAKLSVNGRVMVDPKTFHRMDTSDSFCVAPIGEPGKKDRGRSKRRRCCAPTIPYFAGDEDNEGKHGNEHKREYEKLNDEDIMLANATIRGYSFAQKVFLEFYVDELKEIEWNTKCFDGLVLDPTVKKTVQALVSMHNKRRDAFDDIVKGKGKGLVCVLHGPPGVGKTLTAECVAEFVKRPLYMVSSGDLGTCSADLDRKLTQIMDLASTWRAVLLIDEADVFLEQRALHDLHRNAMVSVFLRVLEYYSGILFLTTNRVSTFDDAFKSRIHIPIRYTELTVESRMQIWRNFCNDVPGGVDIDEKGLRRLAEIDLNGRQIKNAIKAAEGLAAFDGVKVDLEQLLQVTKIQEMFEKDLTSVNGIDYTAPGSSKKNAESRHMFL